MQMELCSKINLRQKNQVRHLVSKNKAWSCTWILQLDGRQSLKLTFVSSLAKIDRECPGSQSSNQIGHRCGQYDVYLGPINRQIGQCWNKKDMIDYLYAATKLEFSCRCSKQYISLANTGYRGNDVFTLTMTTQM